MVTARSGVTVQDCVFEVPSVSVAVTVKLVGMISSAAAGLHVRVLPLMEAFGAGGQRIGGRRVGRDVVGVCCALGERCRRRAGEGDARKDNRYCGAGRTRGSALLVATT